MNTAAAPPNSRFHRPGWREVFNELYRRSKVLTMIGWIHLALLAGTRGFAFRLAPRHGHQPLD